MESSREKRQHIYKSYKLSNCQHNRLFENNYNTPSSHAYFKTSRIQKPSFKCKKDLCKGNQKSKFPYRKSEGSSRKSNKSAEDIEEEERKKKLDDTAKRLLSKIKTWNAEKNISEESNRVKKDCQQSGDCSLVISECGSRQNEEKVSGDVKKRIAHSKKSKLIENRTPKRLKQLAKSTAKYDVNKATVKDFQNRIRHKLIEEIMQMPRENLQNVLNDPKINPIMGLKMSRLVEENRPLITQKLRAMAESKMKALGFASNPQLLVDIDKLIDPVIETDLSVLPYELITQMENVFQVQFDYTPNSKIDSVESGIPNVAKSEKQETEIETNIPEANFRMEDNMFKEDLSFYECSTDEDEEISAKSCNVSSPGENLEILPCNLKTADTEKKFISGTKNTIQKFSENFKSANSVTGFSALEITLNKETPFQTEYHCLRPQQSNIPTSKNMVKNHDLSTEPAQVASPPAKMFTSAYCQTDTSFYVDASTQTLDSSKEVAVLYGVPIPKESMSSSTASLLEEVSAIQNLTNKLNERRLMIFLHLSKTNPTGNFVSDDRMKENFSETLSNGSVYLVDAMEEFFEVRIRGNHNNSKFRSNNQRWKSSNKWVNKSRFRDKEVR